MTLKRCHLIAITCLFLQAAVVFAEPEISTTSYSCRNIFDGSNPILDGRAIDFKEYFEPHPDSFALTYPEVYQQLLALYKTVPSYKSFFGRAARLPHDMSARDILLQYLSGMKETSRRIMEISKNVASVAVRSRFIAFAKDLDAYNSARDTYSLWYHRVHADRLNEHLLDIGDFTLDELADEPRKQVIRDMSMLSSSWVELFVGLNVPGWIATKAHYESLGDIAFHFTAQGLRRSERRREIDVVWNAHEHEFSFAEIKISRRAMSVESEDFLRVMQQLKEMRDISANVLRDPDADVYVHLYYIPAMTQEAIDAFEDIGVIVHTKVIN